MTKAGIEAILDATLGTTTLYIGLIDADGFTGINKETDTMSSHSGWTEFTDYDEATRQEWVPGAVSNKSITNPTPANFRPDTDGGCVGYFITTNSTKGGTTGTLWDIVLFGDTKPILSGQSFQVQHTVRGKDLVV